MSLGCGPSLVGEERLALCRKNYLRCSCSDLVPLRMKWACICAGRRDVHPSTFQASVQRRREWKEEGLGSTLLVKHRRLGKVRFLTRQEKTTKNLLQIPRGECASIQLTAANTSSMSWNWMALNKSDGATSVCFLLCFETVAWWQHCIDYHTTSARLSNSWCTHLQPRSLEDRFHPRQTRTSKTSQGRMATFRVLL